MSNGGPGSNDPQWDGQQWRTWNGREWLTWDGRQWVASPQVPATAAASANGGGIPRWLTIVGLLVALLALSAVVGIVTSMGGGSTSSSSVAAVTYSISGTSSAGLITYATPTGTEQVTAGPPWSRDLAFTSGTPLYVSAQNGGEFGTVTCKIYVDDIVVSSNTSSGAYGIAQCQGTS